MTTIKNTTIFFLKVFEKQHPGNLVGTIQPHASASLSTEKDQAYVLTLAIDRNFRLKEFQGSDAKVTIAPGDLKSLENKAAEKYDMGWVGQHATLYALDINGQLDLANPIPHNAGGSFAVQGKSIYALIHNDEPSPSPEAAIGYFATLLPHIAKDPIHHHPLSPKFDCSSIPNPANPSNIDAKSGLKRQSWFLPGYTSGTTDSDGNHTVTIGDRTRVINGDKDLRLFTGEVAIYQYPNYNQGQAAGSRFWIIKGDCRSLDAFSQTLPETVSMSAHQSVKIGPGTLVTFYDQTQVQRDQKSPGLHAQDFCGDTTDTKLCVKSWTVSPLEAAASAGLEIYTEVGEHRGGDCVHRVTVVGNGFVPSQSVPVDDEQRLQPGRPQTLYISSDLPFAGDHYVTINGAEKQTIPVFPDTLPVAFGVLGHVQITITPSDKSLRTPLLFFRTDKMLGNVHVMADPNEQLHKRLAAAKFDLGNLTPDGNPSLDLVDGRAKGHIKLTKDVEDDDWKQVADITKKANQAVVHSQYRDAVGVHTRVHVDGANIQGFQDVHISFQGTGENRTIQEIKKPQDGLYEAFAKQAAAIKPWSEYTGAAKRSMLPGASILDDLWDVAEEVVVTVGQAVEDGIESAIHVLAKIGDTLYHAALSTAAHIADLLKTIYDAAGAVISAIVKFIRFLISLLGGGLKHTCEAVHNTLLNGIRYCQGFGSADAITGLKDEIKNLTNQLPGDKPKTADPAAQEKSAHQSAAIEKMLWLLTLLTQGVNPNNAVPQVLDPEIAKMNGIVLQMAEDAGNDLKQLVTGIAQNPHQFTDRLFDFIDALGAQSKGHALDLVNTALDILSHFLTDGFETLAEEELTDGLPAPFKNAFDSIMGTLTGQKLSPIGLISALVGVPLTLMYGVAKGVAPAEESGQSFWQTDDEARSFLPGLGADISDDVKTNVVHTLGCISDLMSAITSPLTILSAQEQAPAFGRPVNLVLGMMKTFSSLTQGIVLWHNLDDWEKSTAFAKTTVIFSFLRGGLGLLFAARSKPENRPTIARISCGVDCLAGITKFICGILIGTRTIKVASDLDANTVIQGCEGVSLFGEIIGLGKTPPQEEVVMLGLVAALPVASAGAHLSCVKW